tara:strand:+ start:186 stop:773 length:588 start_codon:yes stop_codon:yes gene_type:complete
MKKYIIITLVLFLVSCSGNSYTYSDVSIVGGQLPQYNRSSQDTAVGAFAPIPTGTNLNGESITVTTRVGLEEKKATVIVFLAHWCSHCQREVPMIKKWLDRNGSPENINLFSVATHIDKNKPNFPPDDWLIREDWNVPVIFDNQNNSIAEHFGLPAFPYWVFLNDDGTINMRHSGSLSEEAFGQIMTAGLVEANN